MAANQPNDDDDDNDNDSNNKLSASNLSAGRHDIPPPRPANGDTIYVMYAYG